MDSKIKARSFFCVLNNVDHIFNKSSTFFDDEDRFQESTILAVQRIRLTFEANKLEPEEIVNHLIELWVAGREDTRSCAINYEISETGTHHCHMILEDSNQVRVSAIKKLFPAIHMEITRGNKADVLAYMEKSGKFEEKQHTVVIQMKNHGVIKAQQGKRTDLDLVAELLDQGMTPEQIMSSNINFRRFSTIIKEDYYQRRLRDTPDHKELKVYWHTGDAGSGKSYTQVKLKQGLGRESVYVWSDYQNGGLDGYQGESVLFMEEYKGELHYAEFLKVTDIYPQQIHARYSNVFALWEEVHITSIFSPKQVYDIMVPEEKRTSDSVDQMMRRINKVVYHFKVTTEEGKVLYKQLIFSIEDFNNHSKEQIERFAYQFDRSNPDVLIYDFEKDAFHSTMNPIRNKIKNSSKSSPKSSDERN